MKKITIISFVTLIFTSFILVIHFNQVSLETKQKLENERYIRITAEENLEQANAQIHGLGNDLNRLTSKISSAQKLLEQAKDINAQLQERLEEASASPEILQQQRQVLEQPSLMQSNSDVGSADEADVE